MLASRTARYAARLRGAPGARGLCTARVLPAWATVDPWAMSGAEPHTVLDSIGGEWVSGDATMTVPDPLNGEPFLVVPDSRGEATVAAFASSLNACPKSGLHNPYKHVERYLMLGDVCARAGAELAKPEVEDFFTRLIQRVAPKSDAQARGEFKVSAAFVRNFSGDQVRFLARSFGVPGDHAGQRSQGMRWPYGAVALISPFNFPLEIPLLQLLGALFMGNKVCMKNDQRVSVVMEQALRLLHYAGLPQQDVDFANLGGAATGALLGKAQPRLTQFTGSQAVAERISAQLGGRVKLEDAGFDWKVLGPDVGDADYVAWCCDQDAYAYSGQKCSAQSILFMHAHWTNPEVDIEARLKKLAARRTLADLTVGPVLTVTDAAFEAHRDRLLSIPGAYLAFGGRLLRDVDEAAQAIPECYGAWEPTAVHVPLDQLTSEAHFEACTKEIFGPFQVLTTYTGAQLPVVLEALERLEAHLTAAVVSNDQAFTHRVLGHTVNGTTYCGRRARTTGAPQNHFFGPAGDPRGAGIGTPEAIRATWSCHREVILDELVPDGWTTPEST
ncbi:Aldehyde/histidinol dehydrogenase [Pelagophyceae sp. CCMP2097]|nr:Aldehyde/histidinol dehydrogenase [Pelagophyceae sp. CCMP2097]|mmetsp:Transcript_2901/g.8630  ORF Transcript_2901/g.8630 Transcript_2901/m.8630 type:complete len:557 (+) Transcript_2901:24-1694(+)